MEYFYLETRTGKWEIGWFDSAKYKWHLEATRETKQEVLQEIDSLKREEQGNEE